MACCWHRGFPIDDKRCLAQLERTLADQCVLHAADQRAFAAQRAAWDAERGQLLAALETFVAGRVLRITAWLNVVSHVSNNRLRILLPAQGRP